MSLHLPPGIGTKIDKPLLYNSAQVAFQQAHQARICPQCHQLTPAKMDGTILCPGCNRTDLHPARAFHRLALFAGRRGGKTLNGAVAGLHEIQIPDTNGMVIAPTFPKLFDLDSTFDSFISRIPPEWVADWNGEYSNLTLINGARIGFRSAEDPQRLRGPGLHWLWMDEAREISEEAWDVVRPALTEYQGVAIITTSPRGEDWVFERFWQMVYQKHYPGYWAIKWQTGDNPIIKAVEVAEAKATMTDKMFRQEYCADFVTFEGAIYDDLNQSHYLKDDEAVRRLIPEWPEVDKSRTLLVGLDSGTDHPFGGLFMVPTDKGIVVFREYLKRDVALSTHKKDLWEMTAGSVTVHWAANKNERGLMVEFAQPPNAITVMAAENDQWAGIQRVQSWIHTGQLFFAYTVPQAWAQMRSYHMGKNVAKSGEKTAKERVYKFKDELPDALRYALMSWPQLPMPIAPLTSRNLDAEGYQTRKDLERLAWIAQKQREVEEGLLPEDDSYPMGQFFL